MISDDDMMVMRKKTETPPPRRRVKKILIPRRTPSVVIPGRQIVFITPDKTTCAECLCFPKEDPYRKPKYLMRKKECECEQRKCVHCKRRLIACQQSPRLLYELAAEVVDSLMFPAALRWSEEDVANWIADDVGLTQYRECIFDNHINGMRLLMLEDPSKLPEINIHYFKHIQMITSKVRALFSTDFVRFARSIGLPPRRPLVHCTWFKSRTGPSWGIRKNWNRCDILRSMKIIKPEPIHLDHWDLVWYQKPDFPHDKFARVRGVKHGDHIPHYNPVKEPCNECLVPRKFRVQGGIPDDKQFIWIEYIPWTPIKIVLEQEELEKQKLRAQRFIMREDSRLLPKKITTEGLKGKDLLLARRKMPTPKFLA